MIRKIGMAATAAAVALGGVALFAGPASAAKPTITPTNSVSCSGLNGKVKFSPPLSNINQSPTTTTAKIKATCTGPATVVQTEKGPVNVVPTAAKAAVTSTGTEPGTCTGLLEPGETPFVVNVLWKASGGKINPSQIVYPNVAPEGGGFGLHDGDTSGSWAGTDNADSQANVDQGPVITALTTPGGCDPNEKGKAKGIKKLTITGGTLTIS